MKRLVLFVVVAVAFVSAWRHFGEISLLVIGQPSSTGLLQGTKEAPFFQDLRRRTGLPLHVTYKPLESVGYKDTFQLYALKDGAFDLVSLRFLQNSEIEPSLQGIDLVGVNSDYATAKRVIKAYSATVDSYLQTHFGSKLLGIWSFGPQEIFCSKPIARLTDLRGRKVRVGSPSLSSFISDLGGTPAVIPFDDTRNALAIGLVDCAVTSAASANFAGWPEHLHYYFPLAVHFGLNGYAISLKKWQALSRREQSSLQATFDAYIADLWQFTQDIHQDAARCNIGETCRHGKPYRMTLVPPSPADVALLRGMTHDKLLEEWGARCDRIHPGCLATWRKQVGQLFEPAAAR
jgi:TRAP-type C4-dicarboxylate transport system substrate-binding protein